MNSNIQQNKTDFKLYLISDRKLFADNYSLFTAVEDALKAGVMAVQLREKDLPIRELLEMAYRMREITSRYSAKLFINDRVDVAMSVDAEGVHLGLSSMPSHAAKKASGGRLVTGVSAHTAEEALSAEKDGADFITFGPVYPTPSKLKFGEPVGLSALRKASSSVKIPVYAIGGITEPRVTEVMNCGVFGVALISAILGSGDIKNSAERFMRILQ